jgi:FkbM family methyltransferase
VGANEGDWTLEAYRNSGKGSKVYSYEPDPRAASIFKKRQMPQEVYLSELAISNLEGKDEIFLNKEFTGLTTMSISLGEEDYEKRIVDTTTLDTEVEKQGIDFVEFLKIDVEGHEHFVLKGASGLLEEERIGCIQFEYGGKWREAGSTLKSVSEFLKENGFNVFFLAPKSLKTVDIDKIGEYFSYSNYVAVHEKKLNKVLSLIDSEPLV